MRKMSQLAFIFLILLNSLASKNLLAAQLLNSNSFSQLQIDTQVYFAGSEMIYGPKAYNNGKSFDYSTYLILPFQKACTITGDFINAQSMFLIKSVQTFQLHLEGINHEKGSKTKVSIYCSEPIIRSLVYNTNLDIKFFTPNHFNFSKYVKDMQLDADSAIDRENRKIEEEKRKLAEKKIAAEKLAADTKKAQALDAEMRKIPCIQVELEQLATIESRLELSANKLKALKAKVDTINFRIEERQYWKLKSEYFQIKKSLEDQGVIVVYKPYSFGDSLPYYLELTLFK